MVEFRDLDGSYFRVKRNGKWQNISFSDLTESEMYEVIDSKGVMWLRNMCVFLGQTIRKIGDEFDLVREDKA
ncbi:MAG: hypothetical protein E7C95_00500 [Anaerococcus prevotii]|uniref:hypothetical protein n=1 Tax=Anaerococcus prevotii TaxID=33034 RepID=UPI0029018A8D|nr:hypothetical protein [Anaerococcus prevotii]MDU2557432.1 hypothetical protein [Anaerococcus prevotii]